jgi:hypothetical protein
VTRYYTFAELYPRWIPRPFRRITITRWIDQGIFPPAARISGNRIAWSETELLRFEATRPPTDQKPPVLWPARAMPLGRGQHGTEKHYFGRGRKRGSRVVAGRVVPPEAMAAMEADG